MSLRLITAPLDLPVTLLQAREHVRRGDVTEDDAKLLSLIYEATKWAETFTGRRFITQTWELVLDAFPSLCSWSIWQRYGRYGNTWLEVPHAPLQSVTHIKYLPVSGAEATLASTEYQVDAVGDDPGRILLAPNKSWPSTSENINAVTIRFVCGYGGIGAVPQDIKAAVLLRLEAFYDRDPQMIDLLIDRAESSLSNYRLW